LTNNFSQHNNNNNNNKNDNNIDDNDNEDIFSKQWLGKKTVCSPRKTSR
jgi:hypothetical protein